MRRSSFYSEVHAYIDLLPAFIGEREQTGNDILKLDLSSIFLDNFNLPNWQSMVIDECRPFAMASSERLFICRQISLSYSSSPYSSVVTSFIELGSHEQYNGWAPYVAAFLKHNNAYIADNQSTPRKVRPSVGRRKGAKKNSTLRLPPTSV